MHSRLKSRDNSIISIRAVVSIATVVILVVGYTFFCFFIIIVIAHMFIIGSTGKAGIPIIECDLMLFRPELCFSWMMLSRGRGAIPPSCWVVNVFLPDSPPSEPIELLEERLD
jgi:hypothetical protein